MVLKLAYEAEMGGVLRSLSCTPQLKELLLNYIIALHSYVVIV